MYIKFIGTGSGKASLTRYHSSLIIDTGTYNLLVDAGDGVPYALLKQGAAPGDISGILISHFHPDHITGLPSLIVQMKQVNRTAPLFVYLHEDLKPLLTNILRASYQLPEKIRSKFEIVLKSFRHEEEVRFEEQFSFVSKNNSHLDEYTGWGLPPVCCSFLFSINGRNVFYSGDIGSAEDLYLFKEKKFKYFITEGAHVQAEDIRRVEEKISTDKIIITHVKEENEADLQELRSEKIVIAEDGLKLGL